MDNLFGAAAMPTPDTPLLHNDEAKPTEIRAADDAASVTAALASAGAPPPLVVKADQPSPYLPPPVIGLDAINAPKQAGGAFTEVSHVRPGPVRRLLGLLRGR